MRQGARQNGSRRRLLALGAAAVVATLVIVAGAFGAGFSLAPAGCVEDNDSPDGPDTCAAMTDGLNGASGVAISPDGTSAYAVSYIDDAIVHFNRDPAGALTPVGSIDDNDTGADSCAADANGLARPFGVTVSADGESVYVAAATDDDAIVHLDRNPTTGTLTWVGCIDDNDSPAGANTCAASGDGLDGAASVVVSPDGESAYAASFEDDAIVHFDRDPTTGALTWIGCIDSEPAGPDTCGVDSQGLRGARAVGITPDGTSVYVAAQSDDAIVRLIRNTTSGTLSNASCIDDNDTGLATCATEADGLGGARSVAISPDGASLYTVGESDDAVVRFDRDTGGGGLLPAGCIDDNDSGSDTCAASTDALNGVTSVAISPDGQSVYASSHADDAVVAFARDTVGGALTPAGCVIDNDASFDSCAVSSDGLDDASEVTVSPDRRSVYTAAQTDDAVARFDRALIPDPPPPGGRRHDAPRDDHHEDPEEEDRAPQGQVPLRVQRGRLDFRVQGRQEGVPGLLLPVQEGRAAVRQAQVPRPRDRPGGQRGRHRREVRLEGSPARLTGVNELGRAVLVVGHRQRRGVGTRVGVGVCRGRAAIRSRRAVAEVPVVVGDVAVRVGGGGGVEARQPAAWSRGRLEGRDGP